MGRHQKQQLTAYDFREAFIKVLSKRVPGVSAEMTDKELIAMFEGATPNYRDCFWEEVKIVLKCQSDWPIKHYANVFLASKYSVKLYQIPEAKKIISYIVDYYVSQGCLDYKQIKQECYYAFAKYDVFPIYIDNYIYHLVKDARRRWSGSRVYPCAIPDSALERLSYYMLAQPAMMATFFTAPQVPRGYNFVCGPQAAAFIDRNDGQAATMYYAETYLESMAQTVFKADEIVSSLYTAFYSYAYTCNLHTGAVPSFIPYIPKFVYYFSQQKSSDLDRSTYGMQVLQSIVASYSMPRYTSMDDMPSLSQFFSCMAVAPEDEDVHNMSYRAPKAEFQTFRRASSYVYYTEEHYYCISQIYYKSQSLIYPTNESFEGCRYEALFEKQSQEYEY